MGPEDGEHQVGVEYIQEYGKRFRVRRVYLVDGETQGLKSE